MQIFISSSLIPDIHYNQPFAAVVVEDLQLLLHHVAAATAAAGEAAEVAVC